MKSGGIDCVVLDLGLNDSSAFKFLSLVSRNDAVNRVPIIIYASRDLTDKEKEKLDKYTHSVALKQAKSPGRLLDEISLFLHRVERALPPEKKKPSALAHDRDAVFQDKKILIVDDDMRNVFALTSVLEVKGIHVVVAKNGSEAVSRFETAPDIDLVLMDIMLPEVDGYEAMRKIRALERFQSVPIIALTAKAMKDDRTKCMEAGASDYMAKPVDTDKLLSLLYVWLYHDA